MKGSGKRLGKRKTIFCGYTHTNTHWSIWLTKREAEPKMCTQASFKEDGAVLGILKVHMKPYKEQWGPRSMSGWLEKKARLAPLPSVWLLSNWQQNCLIPRLQQCLLKQAGEFRWERSQYPLSFSPLTVALTSAIPPKMWFALQVQFWSGHRGEDIPKVSFIWPFLINSSYQINMNALSNIVSNYVI